MALEPFVLICLGLLAVSAEQPVSTRENTMIDSLMSRYWRTLVIRGLVAMGVGVITFFWPSVTLRALVLLFAIYALVEGISEISAGVAHARNGARWWPQAIGGVVSVVAAIVTLTMPALTAVALLAVVAVWALARGVFDIYAAIKLRHEIDGEYWLVLAGAMSIVFGVLLLVFPRAGLLAVIWWLGAYAFALGGLLLYCGLRLHARLRALSRPVAGRPLSA